jgi:hypothetical protein
VTVTEAEPAVVAAFGDAFQAAMGPWDPAEAAPFAQQPVPVATALA